MNAAKARASASSVRFENADRISTPDPLASCARGKRFWSRFTHDGT